MIKARFPKLYQYAPSRAWHTLVFDHALRRFAIKHGCRKDLASKAMLSHRKSSFLGKDDSHGVRAWVLNTRKLCQDSIGDSVDPNVRVTVAVENKDGIDGHGHYCVSNAILQ